MKNHQLSFLGAYEKIGAFVENAKVKSREYLSKANSAYESVGGT